MKKRKELRKGLMLVLSSPSGAGKTSICKKVISLDRKISLSVSYTTRPKRKSEKDGKDYFFVSKNKKNEGHFFSEKYKDHLENIKSLKKKLKNEQK